VKREVLQALLQKRADKRAVALVTDLATGTQTLLDPYAPDPALAAELSAAARRAADRDRSELLQLDGRELLLHVWNPPLRMLIVGAVHIAQTLVPLAKMIGFDVSVIDPRRAFATSERFPGVRLIHAWPERAFAELELDRRSAVVTLSHDPKLDEPALVAALRAAAFYVGALGSRRTHQGRLARLGEQGFSPQELARIKGPVGLAIGAVSPAEIATSIIAEVIQELRRGPA
jgi:xanthine dehydrogenase accessory factor